HLLAHLCANRLTRSASALGGLLRGDSSCLASRAHSREGISPPIPGERWNKLPSLSGPHGRPAKGSFRPLDGPSWPKLSSVKVRAVDAGPLTRGVRFRRLGPYLEGCLAGPPSQRVPKIRRFGKAQCGSNVLDA